MSKELVVLSVSGCDIEELFGSDVLEAVEETGLLDAVITRAGRYMCDYIDCGDWFTDFLHDAIEDVTGIDPYGWEEQ